MVAGFSRSIYNQLRVSLWRICSANSFQVYQLLGCSESSVRNISYAVFFLLKDFYCWVIFFPMCVCYRILSICFCFAHIGFQDKMSNRDHILHRWLYEHDLTSTAVEAHRRICQALGLDVVSERCRKRLTRFHAGDTRPWKMCRRLGGPPRSMTMSSFNS